MHFIAKYKLDGKKIGVMPHILEQQRIFHNILKYKDRFGPTENVIFEE